MRILIVNPNTTPSMTKKVAEAARSVAATGTVIVARNPSIGPLSIEGHYDEAMCVPPMLEVFREGFAQGAEAGIVGCFDDPGLYAVREITDRPVLGLCEASMLAATVVASRFSVVTTLARAIPVVEHLAMRYGMTQHCGRVRAAEVPVLDLQRPGSGAQARVHDEVLRAVAEDRAEAVILGCAGMADLASDLTAEVGIPVIDGVAAATKLAEAFAGLGIKTSKAGAFAYPRVKEPVP